MNRTIQVGMPQMALGCLSENWLLKELGDLHWDKLCHSLRRPSNDLVDSQDRRLYATFIRIRIELEESLKAFPEGDEINFSIDMSRFGRSTVQSTIAIAGKYSTGTATLLTTFSVRTSEGRNALMKSEPAGEYHDIESATDISAFMTEYFDIRAEHGKRVNEVEPQSPAAYQINPYTDSNGANLLYFAAYQNVADFLALRHYPDEVDLVTKQRDIYYFQNSDLTDAISLQPTRAEGAPGLIEGQNLLFRASDGACLAYMSTIKEPA